MQSSNIFLVKTAVILLVFCLAECAAGPRNLQSSCLKYGHSCWGAHGKRSGAGNGNGQRMIRVREEEPVGNTGWYLSKLIQTPSGLRLWRDEPERHLIAPKAAEKHTQNDSDIDGNAVKRPEEPEDLSMNSSPEESEEEVVLMEEPNSLGQKLRLYKLMKNSAQKLN